MKLKHILLSFFVSIALATIFLTSQSSQALPPKANLLPSDYNTGISWDAAQKSGKPVAINFYVDWCHYCKSLAPVLYRIRQEYSSKYNFVYINCDAPENQALVRKFKIDSYPSLFLVDTKKHKQVQLDNAIFQNSNALKKEFEKFLK